MSISASSEALWLNSRGASLQDELLQVSTAAHCDVSPGAHYAVTTYHVRRAQVHHHVEDLGCRAVPVLAFAAVAATLRLVAERHGHAVHCVSITSAHCHVEQLARYECRLGI